MRSDEKARTILLIEHAYLFLRHTVNTNKIDINVFLTFDCQI